MLIKRYCFLETFTISLIRSFIHPLKDSSAPLSLDLMLHLLLALCCPVRAHPYRGERLRTQRSRVAARAPHINASVHKSPTDRVYYADIARETCVLTSALSIRHSRI